MTAAESNVPVSADASPPVEEEDRRSFRADDLAAFFRRALGFWRSEERWLAWALTGGIVLLCLGALFFQWRLNVWNRDFFDAIERRDWDGVTMQLAVFAWIVAFGLSVAVAFVYVRMTLQVRWRVWVTNKLLRAWMARGRAYQLDIVAPDVGNPEYRVATDVRLSTELLVEFIVGFLSAALVAVAFAGVLLDAAGAISLTIAGVAVVVPGYMVVAAILYSVTATTLMFWVGNPLVPLTESRNQAEAEFLFALTRARESAEGIALANGERAVRKQLSRDLGGVAGRWLAIMRRQMVTTFVGSGNGVLLPIIPLLLLAPKYLGGEITLGQMIQLAGAFTLVVGSLNWFFDNFQRFAEWNASVNRVAALVRVTEQMKEAEAAGQNRIRTVFSKEKGLKLKDVSASFENGRVLIAEADVSVAQGERVLIVGDTGAGKSTLVRAIAGIWPWGSGTVTLPEDARIVIVPQKPFLPAGRLRAAVTWPRLPDKVPTADVEAALARVGLAHFVPRLEDEDRWDQALSEGDQERVALARALIQQPDVLILDEAISVLDEASEAQLYAALREHLPNLTLLSIGHRPSLRRFHDRRITLTVERDGTARIGDGGRLEEPNAVPTQPAAGPALTWRERLRRLTWP